MQVHLSTMLTNFSNETLEPEVELLYSDSDNPTIKIKLKTDHYEAGNSTVSEAVIFLQLKTAEQLERYLNWAVASYYVEKQVREEVAQKRLENNNA